MTPTAKAKTNQSLARRRRNSSSSQTISALEKTISKKLIHPTSRLPYKLGAIRMMSPAVRLVLPTTGIPERDPLPEESDSHRRFRPRHVITDPRRAPRGSLHAPQALHIVRRASARRKARGAARAEAVPGQTKKSGTKPFFDQIRIGFQRIRKGFQRIRTAFQRIRIDLHRIRVA